MDIEIIKTKIKDFITFFIDAVGKVGQENQFLRVQYFLPLFDIYCKNPEKCKLLILLNEEEKLMGRALIWVGMRKPTGRVYMDRIYVVNDADIKLYIDYAIENNWLYKAVQGMGCSYPVYAFF